VFKGPVIEVNVKSAASYSASYMVRTRDQKRFTISELAADWHELVLPQCLLKVVHLSPISANNWTHGAGSRHATAPISNGLSDLEKMLFLLFCHQRI